MKRIPCSWSQGIVRHELGKALDSSEQSSALPRSLLQARIPRYAATELPDTEAGAVANVYWRVLFGSLIVTAIRCRASKFNMFPILLYGVYQIGIDEIESGI